MGILITDESPLRYELQVYDGQRVNTIRDVIRADAAALTLASEWPDGFRYVPSLEATERRAQLGRLRDTLSK